jgi:hypothetical protein
MVDGPRPTIFDVQRQQRAVQNMSMQHVSNMKQLILLPAELLECSGPRSMTLVQARSK